MSIPFVEAFDFEYGKPDQLSPLIRRVICKNPGPFTFTGTGTYLIGERNIAVIDPGPANEAHLQAILDTTKGGKITHIFVTHTHKDHCGGTAALKAATGAVIYGASPHPGVPDEAPPALDEGSDYSYTPDQQLRSGDIIANAEWSLEAVHTPGHISNHLCFAMPEESALFTGDHIMGWATTVVVAPDGNMTDYYSSLDLLIERDDKIYYPTHGAPITNPQQFVRAVKIHRQMRDDQIIEQLKNGKSKIMDIVAIVYADLNNALHIAAALNVQAHLDRHVVLGTVSRQGEKLLEAEYRLI